MLITTAGFLFTAIIAFAWYWTTSQRLYIESMRENAVLMVPVVDELSTSLFFADSDDAINELRAALAVYPNIAMTRFYDANGTLMPGMYYKAEREPPPRLQADTLHKARWTSELHGRVTPYLFAFVEHRTLGRDEQIRLIAPIRLSSRAGGEPRAGAGQPAAQTIGYLEILLDTTLYQGFIFENMSIGAGILLGILIIGILAGRFIIRYSMRPLLGLQERLRKLGAGDCNIQVEPSSVTEEIRSVEQALRMAIDELREREEELQEEYNRRQQAMRDKIDAEEANRAKSQFLANMSHELRTPLNAIIGYSEMLLEDVHANQHAQYVEDLQRVIGAGKHLLTIINDVLDLSKIEAGRMDLLLEKFEVADVINEIRATVHPMMLKNGNTLSVEIDAALGGMESDLTKLRQILMNLLANAAKFTNDGRVTLAASICPDVKPESLCLRVADSGIGMSDEQIEKVFAAFTQGDASTTRRYGGTGLGLAISKRFVDMLSGTISVRSELGHGTEFNVVLPLQAISREAPSLDDDKPQAIDVITNKRRVPAAREGMDTLHSGNPVQLLDKRLDRRKRASTIMILDDDVALRNLLTRRLNREGLHALPYEGTVDLTRLQASRPRVVVLGLDTLGGDIDALTRYSQSASGAGCKLVGIHEHGRPNLDFALPLAVEFVKPLDLNQLCESIKQLLRARPASLKRNPEEHIHD